MGYKSNEDVKTGFNNKCSHVHVCLTLIAIRPHFIGTFAQKPTLSSVYAIVEFVDELLL